MLRTAMLLPHTGRQGPGPQLSVFSESSPLRSPVRSGGDTGQACDIHFFLTTLRCCRYLRLRVALLQVLQVRLSSLLRGVEGAEVVEAAG